MERRGRMWRWGEARWRRQWDVVLTSLNALWSDVQIPGYSLLFLALRLSHVLSLDEISQPRCYGLILVVRFPRFCFQSVLTNSRSSCSSGCLLHVCVSAGKKYAHTAVVRLPVVQPTLLAHVVQEALRCGMLLSAAEKVGME